MKMEADFIHSQRKKRRRKNPDHNTVAGNEGKLKLHAQPTTLAPSQYIPHQPPPPPLFSPELNISCIPLHHQLATNTNPDYFETAVFGTWTKRQEIVNVIGSLGENSIYLMLQHYLSTIFTPHHDHPD